MRSRRMPAALLGALALLAGSATPDALAAGLCSVREAERLLRTADPAERARAVRWLGRLRRADLRRRIVPLLSGRLRDPHPGVRREAWNALAALAAREAAPAARRALARESVPGVLPAALLAFAALGSAGEDAARLDAFAGHADPAVQAAALTALARLGAPQARARALALLDRPAAEDPTWGLRAAALLALARTGSAADAARAARIYARTGGPEHWLARSAYARLVAARLPEQVAVLAGLLRDPDPRVALTAAVGLETAGERPLLLGALRDARAGVRAAAVAAVAQVRLAGAYARVRRMTRADTSRRVRWAAAKALWHLRDPLGERLVLVAVGAREPAIWAEAVALLAARTGAAHGRDADAWRAELRRRRRAPAR